MEYCNLGNSGLEVSRVGLGAIPFGTAVTEEDSQRMLDMFSEVGGNLIDTANIYGGGLWDNHDDLAGTSERTVAKIVKGRRDRFVIATKGYWTMESKVRPNGVGLSRSYLSKQIEASLMRLNTDYIDLYQCHARDFYTPVSETMRVLDDFIKAGKIRYIGVSNWEGWHVVKANAYAAQFALAPFVSNQLWYNLVDRAIENSVVPACRDQNVSIIAWGVFAQGFLTGRYHRGDERPASPTRFDTMKEGESSSWERLSVEKNWEIINTLERIAKKHGKTLPVVAARWMFQGSACDVALLGASRLDQFTNILDTLTFELSTDDVEELNNVSEPQYPYPRNFLEIFCKRESELYGGLR